MVEPDTLVVRIGVQRVENELEFGVEHLAAGRGGGVAVSEEGRDESGAGVPRAEVGQVGAYHACCVGEFGFEHASAYTSARAGFRAGLGVGLL